MSAQDTIVSEHDCGTLGGVTKSIIYEGDQVKVSLADSITGRVARDTIVDIITDEVVVRENEVITIDQARTIEAIGFEKIRVRSPLTCLASPVSARVATAWTGRGARWSNWGSRWESSPPSRSASPVPS
jgi:hypothetical protein